MAQRGSRKLRFPDFMTTAQDGGKVVSLTHRPHRKMLGHYLNYAATVSFHTVYSFSIIH